MTFRGIYRRLRDMTPRRIAPAELVEALNAGPGRPREDVQHAAGIFDVNERTVYRRIREHRIQQVCRWELPEAA